MNANFCSLFSTTQKCVLLRLDAVRSVLLLLATRPTTRPFTRAKYGRPETPGAEVARVNFRRRHRRRLCYCRRHCLCLCYMSRGRSTSESCENGLLGRVELGRFKELLAYKRAPGVVRYGYQYGALCAVLRVRGWELRAMISDSSISKWRRSSSADSRGTWGTWGCQGSKFAKGLNLSIVMRAHIPRHTSCFMEATAAQSTPLNQ
jgi:hypothetical protein